MKLVTKTCINPDCEFKEELSEETRFCPECEWEVIPWESRLMKRLRRGRESATQIPKGDGYAE
jgi:hypothetical protein